ncbi:MAG: hypothetical protein MOB07_07085 [Acidobacteria bacterium]|nr:hypothetical protein [Acidobacteriota bacterium]
MAGARKPVPLGRNPEPQDLNDGTMFRGLSPLPGPIGARSRDMHGSLITASAHPIDFERLLQQLREASNLVDLQQVTVLLLGSQCFSAGVIVGIGADIISSAVDLFKLCWTLALADLHDIRTGQIPWWRNLDPTITYRKVMATLASKLFADELRQAAEERDALIRELTEALRNPQELFEGMVGGVVEEYKKDWERFNAHMTTNTLEGRFRAGAIFGQTLIVVLGIITGIGGAAKAIAKLATKLPRLVKYASKIKVKLKPGTRKASGGGGAHGSGVDTQKSGAPGKGKGPAKGETPNEKTKPPTPEERLAELSIDPQTKSVLPKSREEALAILAAEKKGYISNARRPDLEKGEPNLDFVVDGGYADVKTPGQYKQTPEHISREARNIASKHYDSDVKLIVDLKHLDPQQKQYFKQQLEAELQRNNQSKDRYFYVND